MSEGISIEWCEKCQRNTEHEVFVDVDMIEQHRCMEE